MKIGDENFSYLISFLSNLEFAKEKETMDNSIINNAFILINPQDEENLKELVVQQEDMSFFIYDSNKLYPDFKRLFDLANRDNLSLFWGNVSFKVDGNRYFLFLKELNFKKGVGEHFKVSSKTVFPLLNGIPLRNYPVAPEKFRVFKSLLERTNISPFDNTSYSILLKEFEGLFSNNESSQVRLKGLELEHQKGFFLAQSNSFNLFLNLNF